MRELLDGKNWLVHYSWSALEHSLDFCLKYFRLVCVLVLQASAAWCVLMWKFFIVHPCVSLPGVGPRRVKTWSLIWCKEHYRITHLSTHHGTGSIACMVFGEYFCLAIEIRSSYASSWSGKASFKPDSEQYLPNTIPWLSAAKKFLCSPQIWVGILELASERGFLYSKSVTTSSMIFELAFGI